MAQQRAPSAKSLNRRAELIDPRHHSKFLPAKIQSVSQCRPSSTAVAASLLANDSPDDKGMTHGTLVANDKGLSAVLCRNPGFKDPSNLGRSQIARGPSLLRGSVIAVCMPARSLFTPLLLLDASNEAQSKIPVCSVRHQGYAERSGSAASPAYSQSRRELTMKNSEQPVKNSGRRYGTRNRRLNARNNEDGVADQPA
ncbi:hypothetical protein R3P38DRAFT_2791422 [Favolaschia claudopus]|uniref:Uncharacterized protein n=1 Tax=Favolaschia claudopus TaxID=2862362 RepID=A0AAW0AGM5_9AGAR